MSEIGGGNQGDESEAEGKQNGEMEQGNRTKEVKERKGSKKRYREKRGIGCQECQGVARCAKPDDPDMYKEINEG